MKKIILLTSLIAGFGAVTARAQIGAVNQVDSSQNRSQLNRTATAAVSAPSRTTIGPSGIAPVSDNPWARAAIPIRALA